MVFSLSSPLKQVLLLVGADLLKQDRLQHLHTFIVVSKFKGLDKKESSSKKAHTHACMSVCVVRVCAHMRESVCASARRVPDSHENTLATARNPQTQLTTKLSAAQAAVTNRQDRLSEITSSMGVLPFGHRQLHRSESSSISTASLNF